MIKVLLYEDNAQLREGLTMLISGSDGFEVLASFKNCNNVVDEVEAYKPDVILMDIDMPGINGIEGLKRVREHNTQVKVLMLTVFDDNRNVFQAISNGANGYILKKTPPGKLLEYISEAQSGGAPMTASIATQVLKMFSSMNNEKGEDYNLSDREKQVLQLLVEGYSYKMISSDLHITIETVRTHIKRIYEKLHVHSAQEAINKIFPDRKL